MENKFKNGISKTESGSFRVTFWNPLTKTQRVIKTCKTEGEATLAYNEYQWDFYREHNYLLPKGISTHCDANGNKYFLLQGKSFRIDKSEKTISLGYYKTLQDAEEAKYRLIKSLC